MLHRVFLFSIVLLTAFGGHTGDAQAPTPAPLFVNAGAAADLAPRAGLAPGSVRSRATGIAPSALQSDQLLLELFPDTSVQAELVSREVNKDGSLSWSGRVPGQPLSSVTFVQTGSVLQGSVRLDDGAYSIEPAAGLRAHTIRQVNPGPPGEERVPLQAPAAPQADALSALATSSDDGSIIDILVVYTAAARAAAGGTDDAIRARIVLGVTETNTAYANSGVVQRLRLVGAEPIDYAEGGDIGLDLERVTGVDEGFMDGVHARRDQLGADLVSLIVENDSGSCGVAWLMQTPSVTFAPQAFSVTAYDCISPNYTFGHELGHNMGAAHAPDDPNLQPAYPYAYGYKDPASLFRTLMAYNCPISSCPRILYFSNPGVSYGGRATGTVRAARQRVGAEQHPHHRCQLPSGRNAGPRSAAIADGGHVGHRGHVGVDASRFRCGDGLCHRSGLGVRTREPCSAAGWRGNVSGRAGCCRRVCTSCACAPPAPRVSAHHRTRFSC